VAAAVPVAPAKPAVGASVAPPPPAKPPAETKTEVKPAAKTEPVAPTAVTPTTVVPTQQQSPASKPEDQPQPQRIRMGGNVMAYKLVYQARPIYPDAAREARISGVVVVEVVIGIDGTVQSATAVSGHPLLVQPAIDAVSQWRYEPTLLNGAPVEVI